MLALAGLAAAAGGGFAVVESSVGQPGAPTVSEAFGVFARPATKSDAIRTTRKRGSRARAASGGAQSRLAAEDGAGRYYVTHEGDKVCLMLQAAESASSACAPAAEAVAADPPLDLLLPAYPKGRLTRQDVLVLLPDGVDAVRVDEADGRSVDVPVRNNVAVYHGTRPKQLSWTDADGARRSHRGVAMPAEMPR